MDNFGHAMMTTTADLYALVVPAAYRDVAEVVDHSLRPNIQETASAQGLVWG